MSFDQLLPQTMPLKKCQNSSLSKIHPPCSLIQSALIAERKARITEILGKVGEEEPEGEALSKESSGSIPLTSQEMSQ